jgi:hypothetical protein
MAAQTMLAGHIRTVKCLFETPALNYEVIFGQLFERISSMFVTEGEDYIFFPMKKCVSRKVKDVYFSLRVENFIKEKKRISFASVSTF